MRRPRKRTRPSVDPQPIALDPLFGWLKLQIPARAFRALRAFHHAAGPRIGTRARAEFLRGTTLFVRVGTSAWSHELHALKAEILTKLRRTAGGEQVEEIRFQVGPLDQLPSWESEPHPPDAPSDPAAPPPTVPAELTEALLCVEDAELRDHITRLYGRLGARQRP